jgi:hypothetical protein
MSAMDVSSGCGRSTMMCSQLQTVNRRCGRQDEQPSEPARAGSLDRRPLSQAPQTRGSPKPQPNRLTTVPPYELVSKLGEGTSLAGDRRTEAVKQRNILPLPVLVDRLTRIHEDHCTRA